MLLCELFESSETWYHGSSKEIKQFNLDQVGRAAAVDLEGPGIYLTSSIEDALHYGNIVHTVKTVRAPRLVPDKKSFTVATIKNLIDLSPNKEEALEDWDQNQAIAASKASSAIYDRWGPNQFREMLEQVWYDFYRETPKAWLNILTEKLNYDGFILQRSGGVKHFICFNPEILKITEVVHY